MRDVLRAIDEEMSLACISLRSVSVDETGCINPDKHDEAYSRAEKKVALLRFVRREIEDFIIGGSVDDPVVEAMKSVGVSSVELRFSLIRFEAAVVELGKVKDTLLATSWISSPHPEEPVKAYPNKEDEPESNPF